MLRKVDVVAMLAAVVLAIVVSGCAPLASGAVGAVCNYDCLGIRWFEPETHFRSTAVRYDANGYPIME